MRTTRQQPIPPRARSKTSPKQPARSRLPPRRQGDQSNRRIAGSRLTIHKDENDDVFVLVGGVKIAKRGLRGTAYAATWITLQPGWLVRDVKGGKAIEVRYEHAGWM